MHRRAAEESRTAVVRPTTTKRRGRIRRPGQIITTVGIGTLGFGHSWSPCAVPGRVRSPGSTATEEIRVLPATETARKWRGPRCRDFGTVRQLTPGKIGGQTKRTPHESTGRHWLGVGSQAVDRGNNRLGPSDHTRFTRHLTIVTPHRCDTDFITTRIANGLTRIVSRKELRSPQASGGGLILGPHGAGTGRPRHLGRRGTRRSASPSSGARGPFFWPAREGLFAEETA
jgi:hypothetical protein